MSAMTTFPIIARTARGALIASPSSALREQVLHSLNGRWRPVQHALGGAEALVKLEAGDWQVLFLDRRLPDLDSEELIAIIQRRFPEIQVVCLTPMPHSRLTMWRRRGGICPRPRWPKNPERPGKMRGALGSPGKINMSLCPA
jgi:hypothetical protein